MKKTLAIVLSLALLCTLAIGSTLSYFTDEDFTKNTMTVGNVKIQQKEVFANKSALLPYIGNPAETGFNAELNAVTKTVTVENIGTEGAYIRTLFAFEGIKYAGSDNYVDPIATNIIHVDYNTDNITDTETKVGAWALMGNVIVDDIPYFVYSFTYDGSFAGSTETAPSLKAIALDCEQDNTFFEAVGKEYNILVVSQAVQSTGFADAAAAFTAAFPLEKDSEGNQTVIPANWFSQN